MGVLSSSASSEERSATLTEAVTAKGTLEGEADAATTKLAGAAKPSDRPVGLPTPAVADACMNPRWSPTDPSEPASRLLLGPLPTVSS